MKLPQRLPWGFGFHLLWLAFLVFFPTSQAEAPTSTPSAHPFHVLPPSDVFSLPSEDTLTASERHAPLVERGWTDSFKKILDSLDPDSSESKKLADYQPGTENKEESTFTYGPTGCQTTVYVDRTESLGAGENSIIYKGKLDPGPGEIDVAVKIYQNWQRLDAVTKLLQGAALQQEAMGPAVSVLDYFYVKESSMAVVILEWMPAGDLTKSNASPSDKAFIFQQFLNLVVSVELLHELGIFHRDLQPENLLMKEADHRIVKVNDFDLATKEDTMTGDRKGRPGWTSPEIFYEKTYHPKSTDVWNLGMLFLWLRGQFEDQRAVEKFSVISSNPTQTEAELRKKIAWNLPPPDPKNPLSSQEMTLVARTVCPENIRFTIKELRHHVENELIKPLKLRPKRRV